MLVAPSPKSQLYEYGVSPPVAEPLKLIGISVVPEYGPSASATNISPTVTSAVSESVVPSSSVTVRVAVYVPAVV